MRKHALRLLCLVLVAGASSACVTSSARRGAFKPWPAKAPQCDFEMFEEDFEPSRPYDVLGALDFDGNQWLGEQGRKEVLRDTACKAGADVVLLSRPYERKVGKQTIRSYEARFAVYTDVPPPPAVQAEREAANTSPPPPPPGSVVVPSSPWTEEVEGTSVIRKQ